MKFQIRFFSPKLAVCFAAVLMFHSGSHVADEQPSVSPQTVKQAQMKLKEQGYYEGNVDGILGRQTRAGLQRYQNASGLSAYGRLNHETAIKLGIATDGKPGPEDHFEAAGAEIKGRYGEGGKTLGKGAEAMGKDVKKGEVTEGGKNFGKAAGQFGKEIGKGTAQAAKKVGQGVKEVVQGDQEKKDQKKSEQH